MAVGGQPMDTAVLNEIRETVRMVKSETNTLMQKSVRNHFVSQCEILIFNVSDKSCCLSIGYQW